MIAMPLTYPNIRESQAPKRSALPTPFQPLDPGILDASIPAFFIGQDSDGFWLARDLKGANGGIFLFKSSALAFARGNPLIGHLKALLRFAMRVRRRVSQN
jgi:hypothetical protein